MPTLLFLTLCTIVENWSVSSDSFDEPVFFIKSLQVTNTGQVFFIEYKEKYLGSIDPETKQLKIISRRGSGPGELNRPKRLLVDEKLGRLYVWDVGHRKWLIFTLAGEFVEDFRQEISPDLRDNYYLGKQGFANAYAADPNVKKDHGARFFLEKMDGVKPILLRQLNHRQHQDPHTAGFGMYLSFPWDREAMFLVSPDLTRIFVGYNDNLDFWVFDAATGLKIGEISGALQVFPLTDKEIDSDQSYLEIDGKKYDAGSFKHPKTKPAISTAFVDAANRLWIKLTCLLGENKVSWRVFSQKGSYLGQLDITSETKLEFADVRSIWGTNYNQENDSLTIFSKAYHLVPE